MNKWIMRRVLRAKYRKYAIWISVIVHFIMLFIFTIFFINSDIQEIEEAITVELLKIEMPTLEKRTFQKQINVIQPEKSEELKKIETPAHTGGNIQPPAPKNMDVNATVFLEDSDLSTDADLAVSPDSILPPIGLNNSDTGERSYDRRWGIGVRTPSSIIQQLTDGIIASSGGGPIDVVFVVDASGSMQDNINAVAEHLGKMVDAYKASEIDYQLGLTHFHAELTPQQKYQNHIFLFQLIRNLSIYKQWLYEIVPRGDENALDAIHQTATQMQFRTGTTKHLILVTDEPFTSLQGHNVDRIIQLCQKEELYVNVLGNDIPDHKRLAIETDGSWHAVPQNYKKHSQHNTP